MGIWIGVILFLINLYGFVLMGIDKNKAKKGQYRISEKTLWVTAVCGGAVGTTIGMNVFRHKTKHTSFRIGFPLLAVIEVAILILFLK
ncbi:MAG TPA: DUF1294 domain-containing protein [Pseudoneobacillus sp.]|nr:DUF1294 domain-containing protein [Pseudoneobacillus sp.]